MLRRFHTLVLCVLTPLAFLITLFQAVPANATVPRPSTPTGLPSGIEDLARYVGQTSCDLTPRPGTISLARKLVATYPDTSYNTGYACGTDGSRSEHYDGRAIDWMVSVRRTDQRAEASSAIGWMLATDKAGHKFAMARRLGVMYLIWNNKIWGAWSGTWSPYENCLDASMAGTSHDSFCHRNHVHISMSWNGAFARTSFWTKKVFNTTDYGPCRASDMNWAPDRRIFNSTGCTRYPTLKPAAGSSTTYINLLKYSGALVGLGDRGPIVSALQAALRRPVTGYFDTGTRDRLKQWQASRGLSVNGVTITQTWRRLLLEFRPH